MALFIVLFERHSLTTPEAEAASRLLAPVPVEEVSTIKIKKQAGKETILMKEGDNLWRLDAPVDDRVSPENMEEFLDQLSHLTIRDVIPVKDLGKGTADAAELGFADAEVIEVSIEFEDGGSPRKLLIGGTGPFKDTLYVQTLDDRRRKGVYLIDAAFRSLIADPLGELRDRRVIQVHPTRVVEYSMKTNSGVVELERDKDAPVWHIRRPLQTDANNDIAYSLIAEICELEAEQFLDADGLAALGRWNENELDAQTALFQIKTDLNEEFEIVLRERKTNSGGPVTYVKVSGREAVFAVNTDLVSRLPSSVNQLRYPYLANLNAETIGHIRIQSRENVDVDLRSDAQRNWFVVWAGSMVPANPAMIAELIEAMNKETILEFRSDTASRPEQYGLDRPLVGISFSSATVDGDALDAYEKALAEAQAKGEPTDDLKAPQAKVKTREFRFGMADDVLLNVNVEGEPFIYAIDPAFLSAKVPTHPLSWRGLDLFSVDYRWFKTIEVLQLGQPPVRLQQNWLMNEWSGSMGEESITGRIDRNRARFLADHLGNLRAVEWLTRRLEANKALERPSAVVRLEMQKPVRPGEEAPEAQQIVLTFAPAAISGGKVTYYFGRFGQQADAFLLSADAYDRMMIPVLKQN